ncbi:hypothetical protein BH23GEM6_BH23GEM6_13690 [soil metagenome]
MFASATSAFGQLRPDSAKAIEGIVVELGESTPVAGAVVRLMDVDFSLRSTVVTDQQGLFYFPDVQPGRYLLQAEGRDFLSTLSDEVHVQQGVAAEPVVLTVPSALVQLVSSCDGAQSPGSGTLVGVVRDGDTDVALPGARVMIRWEEESRVRTSEAVTDAGGRYHFCSVPVGLRLESRVQAYGRGASETEFALPPAPLSRHDFVLGLFTRGSSRQVQQGVRRGGEADPGSLSGTIVDAETRLPVTGAVVSLVGTSLQQVTDQQGRFRFAGLTPRTYTIHVQHLGYGRQSEGVDLPGGTDVAIDLHLAPQAIRLDGVTVQARIALESARRASPTAMRVIAGDEMRLMELRGARISDVLKERATGVTIAEGRFSTPEGDSPICIQWSRRNPTLTPSRSGQNPYCDMVVVYIDDVRISNPGDVLRGLQLTDFESVQLLSPLEAGVRFGLDAARGVLLLHSRGRGPFTDSARN